MNRRARGLMLAQLIGLIGLTAGPTVAATTLLDADLSVDALAGATIRGNAGRLSWSAGRIDAAYDTSLPTTTAAWALGTTLTDADSFGFSAMFTIHSAGFAADAEQFAQIAFGLINSATTGVDRVGGSDGSAGYAFDHVGFDYLPNITAFGGPALGPVYTESDDGQSYLGDIFADPPVPSSIHFPFGAESGLDEELVNNGSPIPLDQPMVGTVAYSALDRMLTLTVHVDGQPLALNTVGDLGAAGGPDGDATTIQIHVDEAHRFAVDSFALTLWQDTFQWKANAAVVADVTYHDFSVTQFSVPVVGDFNGDGIVDPGDYAFWSNQYQAVLGGGTGDAAADGNGDGVIDPSDYATWSNAYQAELLGGTTAVPEPATLALVGMGGCLAVRRRR